MTSKERDLLPFLPKDELLSTKEAQRLAERPHSQLLAEAFNALCRELDTNGNTPRFQELREEHSKKLSLYWQSKLVAFSQAAREGRLQNGELVRGDERISIEFDFGCSEKCKFEIKRETKIEENKVSGAISIPTMTVDDSFRLPTIKSKIRSKPQEPADIFYEVRFCEGKIITFKRGTNHLDPEQNYPITQDSRTIDCSARVRLNNFDWWMFT